MIKIEIKRTFKKGEEPRDQIKNNKYNIILNIDNEAYHTIQMYQNIKQVRDHLKKLLETIPFAKTEMKDIQTWEVNMLQQMVQKNIK